MSERHDGDLNLRVAALARVEGEGAMRVRVRGGHVEEVALDIYEPPRFFEALLVGRAATEAPDITARICGICPVAYQMSACQAVEAALGIDAGEPVRMLRRLLYCGEWIESHALHIFLLHAPDFLGYPSAVDMAVDHRELVELGLRLKKAGNEVMAAVGGRSVHPVNVRVGGFYRLPTHAELEALRPALEQARQDAVATVRAVGALDFPDLEIGHEYLALRAPGTDYPLERGTVVSSGGLAFGAEEFERYVIEEHVEWSTALHAHLTGGGRYLVGPLARYSLNHDRLPASCTELAAEAGLGPTCRNPFRSIVVRAIELLYACEEGLRLLDAYTAVADGVASVPGIAAAGTGRAATGHGVTEAPRGILYHRYVLDADGTIEAARIVPPTSQNQAAIEADLGAYVEANLALSQDELTHRCEQAIRNYDPCISCATHFLDLTVDRA
jgi:coenzyme F420-reducing hydrogenase alpha subunit